MSQRLNDKQYNAFTKVGVRTHLSEEESRQLEKNALVTCDVSSGWVPLTRREKRQLEALLSHNFDKEQTPADRFRGFWNAEEPGLTLKLVVYNGRYFESSISSKDNLLHLNYVETYEPMSNLSRPRRIFSAYPLPTTASPMLMPLALQTRYDFIVDLSSGKKLMVSANAPDSQEINKSAFYSFVHKYLRK